jgi:hypothetical protein
MVAAREKPVKRIKRVVWRLTAVCLWVRLALLLLGDGHLINRLVSSAISDLVLLLDSLGFAAVSASHVAWVIGAGWVLAITGYSVWQIVLLFLYILSFPAVFLIYLFFGKEIKHLRVALDTTSEKTGLRPMQHHRPVVALCGSALLGWYLLFGDTTAMRPIAVATILSGVFVVLLAYRAFQRAKPISHDDTAPLLFLERMAAIATNSASQQWEKHKLQNRNNVLINIKINRWTKNLHVSLAWFLRGKRGRNRIYGIVVFQYAMSLILLVAAAVLFWAFCLKLAAPTALQFSTCLLISLSHFLPGVAPPTVSVQIPWWDSLGPGLTALVLLGVYVAASSSLLPSRQAAYAQRIQTTYASLRRSAAALKTYVSRLNSLPQ